MQTRVLGNSDLAITTIGVGAWAMGGGGWAFGWGSQEDAASIRAIHAALDAGVNWIDTAMVYGHGHSEKVVGEAIRGLSQKPYVFTKGSRLKGEEGNIVGCLKADSLRRECEQSLKNLGVDVIDLYQLHWPDPDVDIEEGWTTLAELQREGKVRFIGVSNFSVAQLERARKIAPVTSLQPPYSLLQRETEAALLPYCAEHNIGVICYSPMGRGLLTGTMTRARIASLPEDDHRKRWPQFIEPLLSKNLAIVEVLKNIAAARGVNPGEVAIAWCLRRPEVTGAIVGMRSPEQVAGLIQAPAITLTEEELAAIAAA